MARLAAACCLLAALALACGMAAAQVQAPGKGGPKVSVPGKGKGVKPPKGGKFETINVPKSKSGKRDYQVACSGGCLATCPGDCPYRCLVSCEYCMAFCYCELFPGTSCGDPRFTGGDGNTFYFHGKEGKDFCVVSDTGLHINAHFIGNRNVATNRAFTWVQALGVVFGAGDGHRLYVGARKASEWDQDEDHIQIVLDGVPVDLEAAKNAQWVSAAVPGLSVTRTDTANTVIVELDGVFAISANAVPITDEDSRIHRYGKTSADSLVHLDLGFKFHSLTGDVDGVLGQTYRPDYISKVNMTAKMPVMGGAPKYLSAGLFATDCAVSKFRRTGGAVVTFAS